jgi:anti-sigma regulatory factor (Ser/Thr protein kinase)
VADETALLTLELPPRREAPAAARKALTSLNGALHLVSDARLRDAQLMVSELVANAVLHGDRAVAGARRRLGSAAGRRAVASLGGRLPRR